jgi:hypothetical protein
VWFGQICPEYLFTTFIQLLSYLLVMVGENVVQLVGILRHITQIKHWLVTRRLSWSCEELIVITS